MSQYGFIDQIRSKLKYIHLMWFWIQMHHYFSFVNQLPFEETSLSFDWNKSIQLLIVSSSSLRRSWSSGSLFYYFILIGIYTRSTVRRVTQKAKFSFYLNSLIILDLSFTLNNKIYFITNTIWILVSFSLSCLLYCYKNNAFSVVSLIKKINNK